MNSQEQFYVFAGIMIAVAIATLSTVLMFVNGRDWARQYAKLAARQTVVEQRLARYEQIAANPAVLAEALDRYAWNAEVLRMVRAGGRWQLISRDGAQGLDCVSINFAPSGMQLWRAGL